MIKQYEELEARVTRLLADPLNLSHPLGEALHDLWQHMEEHIVRLERITVLSDSFQSMARERERGLCERFERQVQRINRIVRISDRYQLMLRELNNDLAEASKRDMLTGVPNRRALMDRLQQESERAARSHRPFVVAMIDVDHFKGVNDVHGHDAGDRILVETSRLLCSNLREYDACGRWGGEEFLIVLPETHLHEARTILERKHKHIRTHEFKVGDQSIQITISTGLAQHRPGDLISSTLSRADAALYLAKNQGRDRIEPIRDGNHPGA